MSMKRVAFFGLCGLLLIAGCKVGPNYQRPAVPTTQQWHEAPTTQVSTDSNVRAEWWKSFNDPTLDKLVEMAYGQNLTLQVAGLRVLQARAIRGIEVGRFFPQEQAVTGSYTHNGVSRNLAVPVSPRFFNDTSVG